MNSAEIIAFDIRCNIIFYGEHLDRSTIGNYEQRWINTINHRGYDYLYAGKKLAKVNNKLRLYNLLPKIRNDTELIYKWI